jgi:hypothetical protein
VLIQADGMSELDEGRNAGDPGDLFQPGPAPIFSSNSAPSSRWWNGALSGLQVTSIVANNGQVSFFVTL